MICPLLVCPCQYYSVQADILPKKCPDARLQKASINTSFILAIQYEANNGTDSSGFQNAPDNNHPPDMIRRMMDLMEILMVKVDNLEKSAPNH